MTLVIDKKGSDWVLSLQEGDHIIDSLILEPSVHLDQGIFDGLDKILQRNTMDILRVQDVIIGEGVDLDSSAGKILTAFRKGILFSTILDSKSN